MVWLDLFLEWLQDWIYDWPLEWLRHRRTVRRHRRAVRRFKQTASLLSFLLLCILCNVGMIACGGIAYMLQEIGILPPPTPVVPDTEDRVLETGLDRGLELGSFQTRWPFGRGIPKGHQPRKGGKVFVSVAMNIAHFNFPVV